MPRTIREPMTEPIISLHRSALVALNKGDYKSLHRLCSQMIKIDDRHADAWFFLSIIASVQNQFSKALEFVDRALSITPSQTEYLSQKAKYHCVLKQDDLALNIAENAVALKPNDALTLDTLGVVYTSLGKYEKARDLLAHAVREKPNNAQFQFNLATAEQFLGNAESAKKHYEKAIDIRPNFARAYWSLSELEKDKLDGTRKSSLVKLLKGEHRTPEDTLYLSHALSREYEQEGEYKKAMGILKRGKESRTSSIKYAIEDDKAIFDCMKTAFSETKFNTARSELGEGVIFIVGMPRSGTTLVERILSSHSNVASLGELQNFGIAVRRSVESSSTKTLDSSIIGQALTKEAETIGQRYLDSIAGRRPKEAFFIDKMPLNFLYIGFIARSLPRAKIVCLRRNPLDTCLSNYRQLFAINFSYYNYHYSLEDTARYFSYFDDLMSFWKVSFPNKILEISYELLTQEPKKNIENLLHHLGLDWQQSCLDFHKNKSAVATPSATQVREKLYTKAVGRWQKYEEELKNIMILFDTIGIDYR